jgi:hypothetical protein
MLPLLPRSDKDVIRDSVPSIVNANEEQQQRCRAHEEQGWARMGVTRVCRYSQNCGLLPPTSNVCFEGKTK